MKELDVSTLKEWMQAGKEFRLVDVREPYEHDHYNIGGLLLPLGELMGCRAGLPQDVPVVIYCEKGIRSIIAVQRLEGAGFRNVWNLAGGMKAWRLAGLSIS